MTSKEDVRDFWNEAACGEKLYLEGLNLEGFRKQAETRYELDPFIIPFADFDAAWGKRVLEIGVSLGADHQRFAEAGAILTGVDLTPRAIEMTRQRFNMLGLKSELHVGDAENLDLPDNSFDIVYSWGVIHHSPDTQKAINEIFRVLKRGGRQGHDLPQIQFGWLHALASLRPYSRQTFHFACHDLCEVSRKPGDHSIQ
jgi:SAM-dependent methyltransferase